MTTRDALKYCENLLSSATPGTEEYEFARKSFRVFAFLSAIEPFEPNKREMSRLEHDHDTACLDALARREAENLGRAFRERLYCGENPLSGARRVELYIDLSNSKPSLACSFREYGYMCTGSQELIDFSPQELCHVAAELVNQSLDALAPRIEGIILHGLQAKGV